MKQYLSTLHTRDRSHKKRFALLVSGGATLLIFAFWSAIVLREPEPVVANKNFGNLAGAAANDLSPFESLGKSFSSAWKSLIGDGRE